LKRGDNRRGLHGMGEGGGGIHGTVVREEEEATLDQCGEGGREVGWAAWAERPNKLAGGGANWAEF
jgi:hypothetical protein